MNDRPPSTPENAPRLPLIRIRGLTFRRGRTLVLNNLNLDIRRQGITALIGPSGCGKTTLLRIITGQLRPHRGSVQVDGVEVSRLPRKQLLELRKRMGMLFQNGALFSDLSVFDNVAFPLREHTGLSKDLIHILVLLKLQAVGLRGAHDLNPEQLSGGMARRAAMARAMAMDPMLMMYDEPFTGQDPISMGMLLSLVQRLNHLLGMTSIVVSHDIQEVLSIADDVCILSDGRIIEQGTPELLRRSKTPLVRQFLDAAPDGPVPFHYTASSLERDLAWES